MKKLISLVCVLCLLLTVFAVPCASAMVMSPTVVDYTGNWVCLYVDMGDGELMTEYEGYVLQDALYFVLQDDGTLDMNGFGETMTGSWSKINGGVSLIIDDLEALFVYEDDMLVNTEDSISMYFARPQPEPTATPVANDVYTGDWVCKYVDLGDGVKVSEYDGASLQDFIYCTLSADGTAALTSYGTEQSGTWQVTDDGISMTVSGMVVLFAYTDDQLVNDEDGVIMYFARANAQPKSAGFHDLVNLAQNTAEEKFQFAGTWQAVAYEVSGTAIDIGLAFPDGFTITLLDDGTGSAQITPDYAEALTWSETDDGIAISSSYLLYNPVWDADTNTLTLNYATDVVLIGFQKTDTAAAAVPTAAPTVAPTPTPTAVAVPTEAPTVESALPLAYTCEYFSASFPEGWEENEYSTYNWDQYYAMQYDLNDQDGWAVSYISIVASVEEVATYRSELATLTEYAQESGKDALDELVIDGITFQGIVYGDYWIYGEYTARVPEASITLTLTISEPEDIADVLPDILASIRFTFPIPDPPYTDPPLPEDGIAYVPAPTAVTVGGYELSAAWLPTSASIIAKDTYNTGIACIDDLVYILDDTTLYSCKIENSALVSAAEPMKLDQSYCFMCSDVYGSLYLTDGFYSGLTLLEGDTNTFTMDGYLAMHPDGGWGLTFWSSYDVSKATFTSDGIAVKPWFLTNLSDDARQGRFSSIGTIAVTQDAVFVAGTDATTDYATRIAMYDFDGNELAVYGSTDWLNDSAIGSVSAMIQTPNGILVQDAFYGSLILFALDGTYLGSVACDDLLGTQYCRPLAMAATPDGALLLVAQEREDQSATELLVFEVTGF